MQVAGDHGCLKGNFELSEQGVVISKEMNLLENKRDIKSHTVEAAPASRQSRFRKNGSSIRASRGSWRHDANPIKQATLKRVQVLSSPRSFNLLSTLPYLRAVINQLILTMTVEGYVRCQFIFHNILLG